METSSFEILTDTHTRLLHQLEVRFTRYIKADWNDRLISIIGARGVGKTTFLLSRIKSEHPVPGEALYASLDDLYFTHSTLVTLADTFIKKGGKYLYLDEIHKYPNWGQELKNIYDRYRQLKVVATGSSILHIRSSNADLSRRMVLYSLEGLSFREFLNIESGSRFDLVSLEDLLTSHVEIANNIVTKVKPLAYFDSYLKYGFYPYYLESKDSYHRKLLNTILLMMEIDLPYLRNVDVKYIHKLKKLLTLVSQSVPYQPNVSKLAADIETSRATITQYLQYLEESKMLNLLRSKGSNDSMLAKPEKVYLHHPNLMHALSLGAVNKGSERETFFYNQLANVHTVNSAPEGDFLINGKYTFEIGGKNKSDKQLKRLKNSFVAADMIETGHSNVIPLWLFGFLY